VHGGPYDTRVAYDAAADRFVIVAHMRNSVWTNSFGANAGQPYSDDYPTCDVYRIGHDTYADATDSECLQARRIYAIAVSRTDDPRDGFTHTASRSRPSPPAWTPWTGARSGRSTSTGGSTSPGAP